MIIDFILGMILVIVLIIICCLMRISSLASERERKMRYERKIKKMVKGSRY